MASSRQQPDSTETVTSGIRRIVVIIVGFVVLLAGIVMLPLPGPGTIVILGGLFILATQLRWARRLLHGATGFIANVLSSIQNSPKARRALKVSGTLMIVCGLGAALIWRDYAAIGIFVAVAGVIGLYTLRPSVQNWLQRQAAKA